MSISFPNASRSYDANRGVIRFWGHDSAMEAAFLITSSALHRIEPDMPDDEGSLLAAFDRHRVRICSAAAKIYTRGRKTFYTLDACDF
jgi:Protein of unknown function (DUF1488)